MARNTFGGSAADAVWSTVAAGGYKLVAAIGGHTVTFWSAETGGTQYTDLLVNGSAATSVSTDASGQLPEFQGPDGVTSVYADAGAGRVRIDTPALTGLTGEDDAVALLVGTGGTATQTAADARYAPPAGRVKSKVKTDGSDQGAALQAEIDALSGLVTDSVRGAELLLPRGIIAASGIILRDRVTLRGVGKGATVLKPLAGSSAPAFVTIPAGPVQYAYLRDLTIQGNGVAGQHGVYFYAQGDGGSPDHGGWWYSGMTNVRVGGFDGVQIWLRGGGADLLKPHQFLTFTNVEAWSGNANPALRLSGQVGQVEFLGPCEFDGPGQANPGGLNIDVRREVNDDLSVKSDAAPYSVDFRGTTTQSNELGVSVDRATSVHFAQCHMEALSGGYFVTASGVLFIDGGTVSSVGSNSGNGYIVQSGSGFAVVSNLTVPATADVHFKSANGGIVARNCSTTSGPLKTSNLSQQVGIGADGSLAIGRTRSLLVNSSATVLKTISDSGVAPGESVFLKAFGGTIVLGSGGNISAAALPVTVANKGVVQLLRMDLAGTWNIVSVSATG